MPKKCKNPLMTVSATISYYMELNNIKSAEMYERVSMSKPTWYEKKRSPERFTLQELSMIARVLDVDMAVLILGLIPKGANKEDVD